MMMLRFAYAPDLMSANRDILGQITARVEIMAHPCDVGWRSIGMTSRSPPEVAG